MAKINFKLSDSEKYEALWNLLNSSVTEEGESIVSYVICDVYDDYALTYNIENNSYERIYYSKNDEDNSVKIDDRKTCYIIEVSESEKNVLETLRAQNGDTYENLSEKFSSIENLQNTIDENNNTISSLKETNSANEQKISTLETELNSLKDYKNEIETAKKNEIIEKYSAKLEDNIINKYKNSIDTYSILDLEKELSFELVQAEPEIFSRKEKLAPKLDGGDNGIGDILAKYKK